MSISRVPPHKVQAIRAALAPLADAGLSVFALNAKYDGLIPAIRSYLPPDEFDRLAQGARTPEQPQDWFPINEAANAVMAVLSEP